MEAFTRKQHFVLVMVFIITALLLNGAVAGRCQFETIKKPRSWGQYTDNYRYTFTCIFKSTCRPKLSFFFNRYPNDEHEEFIPGFYNEFLDVNSWRYRIFGGMSFDLDFTNKGDQYTAVMTIDPFKYQYAGQYRCVISDPKDPGNMRFEKFVLEAVQLSPFALFGQCFVPQAQNITVIPGYLGDGNVEITLLWVPSVKEDPELDYCLGSRNWKVRVLGYSNIADAPGDYEVRKEPSISWIKIEKQNTSYLFSEVFSSNVYYSFQVGHREDLFSESQMHRVGARPGVFASPIYYFGFQEPAMIDKSPSNRIKLLAGSSTSVVCTATGFPPPSIDWVRISGSAPSYSRKNNSAVLELNHVTEADAGDYFCVSFNVIVNPPKGRRDQPDSWKITVEVEAQVAPVEGLSCAFISLDSSICKDFIYDKLKIFTNHSSNETSIAREKRALDLRTMVNYEVPLGKCRDLGHSIMCHVVYPYCDARPRERAPSRLCKSVCDEFVSGDCMGLISNDSSFYKFIMENCDERVSGGGEPPECISLSLKAFRNDQYEPIEYTGDCVRGKGRGYTGSTYRTKSGTLCQMWSQQSPHSHPMLPEVYRSDLDHAELFCRNPGGIGAGPWCYTSDPAVRWEYCDIPNCDSCEMYSGDICMKVEGYSNMTVTVRKGKRISSMEAIRDKISLFSKSILFMQPTEGCRDIVQVLLCHGAFPQCTGGMSKQLCANHCRLCHTLEDLCPEVYKEYIKFLSLNGDFMSKIKCGMERDQCMGVSAMAGQEGVLKAAEALTSTCYEGTGSNYNGTVSQTIGGLECQSWDVQQPHSHSTTPSMYPILQNSKNYCRNPGNLLDRPWCYTTSEKKVWDYCDIQICSFEEDVSDVNTVDQVLADDPTGDIAPANARGSNHTLLISVVSVVFFTLTVLMLVAFCLCYFLLSRKNQKTKKTRPRLSTITREALISEKYVTNKDYTQATHTKRSGSLIIPQNFKLLDGKDIKYVSQLGQGNFGIVFKGKAFGIKEGEEVNNEGIDVAVKTLKEEASSEVKEDFIDEAKLMFTFDHPNILKIHGVCMSEMPYQLVFEYMDEGDLTKFLRARASSQQRRLINPFSYRSRTESSFSDDPPSLTKTQLLYICKQIAAGMKYLAENNHIHRDLACRNCLVRSDLVVKIGDFGMSRNLYNKDYYRINGNAVLPVRWMSPESLIYGKFSVEGDVWSYGVVMWEVFSFALQPYYGISNEEVIEAIRQGKTLNRPDDCPIEVYRLMKECWAMDPGNRISFLELCDSLSGLHHICSVRGSLGDDYELSSNSDMPSDAFYSEENLDSISREIEL